MCCLSFLSYNFVKFVYFGFIIIYCFNWIINRFFSCFKFGLTKPDSNLDIVFLIPCNFQIYSLIQIIHSISHILMNEKKKIRKQLFFEQKYVYSREPQHTQIWCANHLFTYVFWIAHTNRINFLCFFIPAFTWMIWIDQKYEMNRWV